MHHLLCQVTDKTDQTLKLWKWQMWRVQILPMILPTLCSLASESIHFPVGSLFSVHYPIMLIVHLKQSNIFDTLWIMSGRIRTLPSHNWWFKSVPPIHLQMSVPACHRACPQTLIPTVEEDGLGRICESSKKSCLKSCSQGHKRCLSTWPRCPKCSH